MNKVIINKSRLVWLDLLVKSGVCKSKGEARRLFEQGAVSRVNLDDSFFDNAERVEI